MITRLLGYLWLPAVLCMAYREHKVHNIVLYPDKHSWCKTTPIKQVVGAIGCTSVEVDNNVCVGGCFSYTIPRTQPTSPGQVKPYCDSCQPLHVTWRPVTLKCNSKEIEGGTLVKRVEIIEECSCMSCARNQNENNNGEQEDGISSAEEHGHQHHAHSPGDGHHHPIEVAQLINLESTDSAKHENLSNLLKYLGTSGDDDVSLNDILSQMDRSVDYNKVDHLDHEVDEHLKLKMSAFLKKLDERRRQEHHHQDLPPPSRHHTHHHHHHHVHGPHHSMVLTPDDFPNPTLDMEDHHLKPAVEGSEITYHPTHHHDTDTTLHHARD